MARVDVLVGGDQIDPGDVAPGQGGDAGEQRDDRLGGQVTRHPGGRGDHPAPAQVDGGAGWQARLDMRVQALVAGPAGAERAHADQGPVVAAYRPRHARRQAHPVRPHADARATARLVRAQGERVEPGDELGQLALALDRAALSGDVEAGVDLGEPRDRDLGLGAPDVRLAVEGLPREVGQLDHVAVDAVDAADAAGRQRPGRVAARTSEPEDEHP